MRIFIAHDKKEDPADLAIMAELLRNAIAAAGGDPSAAEITLGRDDFAARVDGAANAALRRDMLDDPFQGGAGGMSWEDWSRSVAVGTDDMGDPLFQMLIRPVRLSEILDPRRTPLTLNGNNFAATAGRATGQMLAQALEAGRSVLWLGVEWPIGHFGVLLDPQHDVPSWGEISAVVDANPKDWKVGHHILCAMTP